MQSLKFRVWNIDSNSYEDGLKIGQNGTIWFAGFCGSEATLEQVNEYKYKVEQFTGLTDKNGKNIYEGDVVKTFYGLQEIAWHDIYAGWFCFNANYEDDYIALSKVRKDIEVVGNIHENPELTKEEE